MKKYISLLFITLFIFSGCTQAEDKNPKYTYGTYSGDISSVYNLAEEPSSNMAVKYKEPFGSGVEKEFFVCSAKTTDGGIVAYYDGKYVYSPDSSDKEDVINECISLFI